MGGLSGSLESPVNPDSTEELVDALGLNSDSKTLELAFSKIVSDRDNGLEQKEGFYPRKNGSLQRGYNSEKKKKKKKKQQQQVFLEGYGVDDLTRTRSLTDEDLYKLKGCVDLGFGFSYDEIPELCNTLPALELCYSMSQRFLDHQHNAPASLEGVSSPSYPVANWKISSPGDHPEEVKARLKFWAQAVACSVKLCS